MEMLHGNKLDAKDHVNVGKIIPNHH